MHFFQNHKKSQNGQAIIIVVVFFLLISLTIVIGVMSPVVRETKIAHDFTTSREGYFAAEALNEDIIYRLANNLIVQPAESLTLNGSTATATISDVLGAKQIIVTGNRSNLIRRTKTLLSYSTGSAFFYGVQSGEGGFVMENSSSVKGSLFSNGPVSGSGSSEVQGDVISGGPTGLIDGIHSTSSAYAHTIQNSQIDKDAHYQAISGTLVGGVSYPGSVDQATGTLPISDSEVADWESAAAAGGTISSPCPYRITSNTTIGPKKITCDLEIDGTNIVVNLAGPLWVTGNISFSNSPDIKVSAGLGNKSVVIIADKPTNRLTSSQIEVTNSTEFFGSGFPNSYVLLLSQNNSVETGGSEVAIDVANSTKGALLVYAGHGEIMLQNSVSLKEITAYRIRLKNSTEVIYETGLANLLFSAGPGGGYNIQSWEEIQ